MKITGVEAYVLSAPQPEREFWVSWKPVFSVNELVVKVHTDAGVTGVGLGTAGVPVRGAAELFARGFGETILQKDPFDPAPVLEKLLGMTYGPEASRRGWGRSAVVTAAAAVDNALWDIKGKAEGRPLYQMLGGSESRARTYAGGGYYREGKGVRELVAEMERSYDMGHRAFKMKVGGLALKEDVGRVAAVRGAIGPECALAVDVNGAWGFEEALRGAEALQEFDLAWLEEPLGWREAKRSLPKLRKSCPIPIAEGHGEVTVSDCLLLIESGAVDYIQFDATKFEGVTGSREIVASAEAAGLSFIPHHDPQIHAHLVAASPAGFMCESHADPERDPVWFELFEGEPELKEGWLY
ncbi:MAG: mandelate racemase/muconate lactonizing enzyme family protein, partial [bacterium]|nr:mandelate racemase/muconate lactonizing enzyme family protein [bacterium]